MIGPTCATHSAVQMRPHFAAGHFMDVISPSIKKSPLQPAVPGRPGSLRCIVHFGHPGLFVPRVNAERAGLSRKRPPDSRVSRVCRTSPQNFALYSMRATWRRKNRVESDCRLFVTSPTHSFCLARRSGELPAAPSSSDPSDDLCH